MNISKIGMGKLARFKNLILELPLIKKLIILAVIIGIGWFSISRVLKNQAQQPQYQTAQAEKGTLITSISASGSISQSGSVSITTQATGTIKEVYIADGDSVTAGQKIAEITLDAESKQKQAAAWASYLSAINSQKTAENAKLTADSSMWSDQQKVLDAQNNLDFKNNNLTNPSTKVAYTDLEKQTIDSALVQAKKAFSASEQKYKDADASINSAKAQVNSAWLEYQQTSATITAPIAGVISGFNLTPGLPISSSQTANSTSTTTDSSASQQTIGTIQVEQGTTQASVNLTEIDVVKVKTGQKVTLTLDALPDKTFTGKVSIVNTNGSVSSGVTTYPTTITFDTSVDTIYPNMAVNATIITDIKNGVVLVPSGAIQTTDGQSTVGVMKNGQVASVQVEVGGSNDTQTEILSGVNAGDTVVTGQTGSSATGSTDAATSPFGNTRGGFGGAGGGSQMFIQRR